MKETIGAIHLPPSRMNAVFVIERALVRKPIMLAGFSRVKDEHTTVSSIEAMVWRDDRKAWFRAREIHGFLGVEFEEFPVDWGERVQEFLASSYAAREEKVLEERAGDVVRALEQDRASRAPVVPAPERVASPPVPRRSFSLDEAEARVSTPASAQSSRSAPSSPMPAPVPSSAPRARGVFQW